MQRGRLTVVALILGAACGGQTDGDSGSGSLLEQGRARTAAHPCLSRPALLNPSCWGDLSGRCQPTDQGPSEACSQCVLRWELPSPDAALPGTPTRCEQIPFSPDATNAPSATACEIPQVAPGSGSGGWYLEVPPPDNDLSCDVLLLAFTPEADPPPDVGATIDCGFPQDLLNNRTDIQQGQPTLGDRCDSAVINGVTVSGDDACAVALLPGTSDPDGNGDNADRRMLCHENQVCVLACDSDADCPPYWVCDDRQETVAATTSPSRLTGTPICAHPSCI